MVKRTLLVVSLFILFAHLASGQEITVAAAASVQFTLDELKAEFEKETGLTVKTIIGSSGNLTAQIENGAPFDIFLSADMDYPLALDQEGMTLNPPRIYVYGALVLWTLKDLDLSKGVESLSSDMIQKVAVANPKTAPYGREAVNALKYYNAYKMVGKKLVYGESVAQVNQFIMSQAADVGFTAKSVVLSSNMQGQGKWVAVDPKSYSPIAQGVVLLRHAKENNLKQAQQFFDFLFSDKAKIIFEKYGYVVPARHE